MRLLGLTIAVALIFAASAHATTYVVDRSDDADAEGCTQAASDCTLRGAIIKANGDANDSTIMLPAARIALTAPLPSVEQPLTIQGQGARSSIIDGSAVSDFSSSTAMLLASDGISLDLQDLQLTDFNLHDAASGLAALDSGGPSTLDRVAIVGNDAVGWISRQVGTLQDSLIAHNLGSKESGGILAGGVLVISDSTVADNEIATPADSTDIGSGGILLAGAVGLIENSTIAGNSAAPGTVAAISDNFGTVSQVGPEVALRSSIIAGSSRFGDCGVSGMRSLGHNLDSDGSCDLTQRSDLSAVNPQLAALANNGGPTDTMALRPGSPAIDAGSGCNAASVDQRGRPRIQGTTCDIGAFESSFTKPAPMPPPPTIDTTPPKVGVGHLPVVVSTGTLRTGLRVQLRSSEPSVVRWTLVTQSGRRVAGGATLAGIPGEGKLTLKVAPARLGGLPVRLQLRLLAVDAAGNPSSQVFRFTARSTRRHRT
jgi:hypothetical protein